MELENEVNVENVENVESEVELTETVVTPEENDLFADGDLFGGILPPLEDEKPKTKKVPRTAKAKVEAKPVEVTATAKATTALTLDPTWNIAYAGHLIPVPEENMTVDRLHEFMEIDFPELAKRRSKAHLDKDDKLVTFAPNAAKKG